MKPQFQSLIIAALGLAVAILLIQGHFTATEVESLRQQVAAHEDRPPLAPVASAPAPADDPAWARWSDGPDRDESQERIAALEQQLSAVTETLNEIVERVNRTTFEAQRARQPAFSAGQATGAPDTLAAEDLPTAWAPASEDGGAEWLQLDYETAVEIAQVRVRQNCGAGCIAKVAAVLESGREVVIWQGRQDAATGIVEAPFHAPAGLKARGVRVYLDTARVPGWNEIDAVELIGRDGSRQWASGASASSTYGVATLSSGLFK
jgi:hypothetical protein